MINLKDADLCAFYSKHVIFPFHIVINQGSKEFMHFTLGIIVWSKEISNFSSF